MAQMIELMRQSAVPANIMRTAARGALSVPPAEMIEILVFLASHPIFGQQATMTLAGWDAAACSAVCSDPHAPAEVLAYFSDSANLRPALLPALLENAALPQEKLLALAGSARRDTIRALLASPRVLASKQVLRALSANPNLEAAELDKVSAAISTPPHVETQLAASPPAPDPPAAEPPAAEPPLAASATLPHVETQLAASPPDPAPAPVEATPPSPPDPAPAPVEATPPSPPEEDADLTDEQKKFLEEHAAEIAAGEGKPFELVGTAEDAAAVQAPPAAAPEGVGAAAGSAGVAVLAMQQTEDASAQRESVLQKIARLSVGERVQVAMKGSKDERFILVRDGNKVVSLAVLQSPKLSDSEVENFAGMKNVQEGVLRAIAGSRKFLKNYNVLRALVNNPRCPLDVALTLLKNLLPADLNSLSKNKNVPETLRKVAFKNFREKTAKK